MTKIKSDTQYYIISPNYTLRGWNLLPYALQEVQGTRTMFFRKWEFELLKQCDGHTAIHTDTLSEEEKERLEQWLKS